MGGLETYVRELLPALLARDERLELTIFVTSAGREALADEPWAGRVRFQTPAVLRVPATKALAELTVVGRSPTGRRADRPQRRDDRPCALARRERGHARRRDLAPRARRGAAVDAALWRTDCSTRRATCPEGDHAFRGARAARFPADLGLDPSIASTSSRHGPGTTARKPRLDETSCGHGSLSATARSS